MSDDSYFTAILKDINEGRPILPRRSVSNISSFGQTPFVNLNTRERAARIDSLERDLQRIPKTRKSPKKGSRKSPKKSPKKSSRRSPKKQRKSMSNTPSSFGVSSRRSPRRSPRRSSSKNVHRRNRVIAQDKLCRKKRLSCPKPCQYQKELGKDIFGKQKMVERCVYK
jgi:hypothetical protein